RVNPLTPDKNQELTAKLGKYHAAFLDRIGSLYFTRENYDDFYYGKGSTYPDVNGSIGILFEQASSRGHAQQTNNGILRFPFTIRNQFITTLSTLEGAKALRKEFLAWQRDFYKSAMNESSSASVKAYVFGDVNDRAKTFHFTEMLKRHQIEVYALNSNVKFNNLSGVAAEFQKGSAFIVPANQPQYRLIRAIFEKTTNYKDSLFYDITSWTMPLAFGLSSAELGSVFNQQLLGEKITNAVFPAGEVTGGKSNYAYLLEWNELYAPAALFELLKNDVLVKCANNGFEMELNGTGKKFPVGTLLIPVGSQSQSPEQLFTLLQEMVKKYGLKAYSVTGGNVTGGSDLGSSRFGVIVKPSIAMITGPGVFATDAGEVWHLLDQRFNIPATHLEPAVFNRIDLGKYNTIIMVGGTYGELNKDKLRAWVQNGGVLITTEEAVTWAAQNGITNVTLKKIKSPVDSSGRLSYLEREQVDGSQQMNGAIFSAELDPSHPLAFGYHQPTVSLFKANKVFLEKSKNPYATPFFYKDKPLQSGWVSKENYDALKNSAAVVVSVVGSGRVINIADNPNFRAFWLGSSRLFMNAIFFGRMIDAASARTEE
ncbi:MAG TPA: zinc carboxypeptidase, partial [Chitinophagaceae bacterium]|nr:zinc carboxypeptidase [Chitinophagaceae bacterium]